MPKLNAFLAHAGGPTTVLNASLLGVLHEARRKGIGRLWAARGGLGGLLQGHTFDLLEIPERRLAHLSRQPGSLIGSYRGTLTQEDLGRMIDFFRRREIRLCFYTGGNGSMGTALRIARAATTCGYELRVIGIPKTMDNDIFETDHCPGFGSAARFVITAVRDIGLDQRALPSPVSIIEVMGRNVGWLAASSILARHQPDDPPHFVYVPERLFDPEEFLTRVDRLLRKLGWVVGVVAEGLRNPSGRMMGASGGSNRDARGRPLAGNVSVYLASLASRELKVRARSEKPGLLCRAFSSCRSNVDAREAYATGRFAVRSAVAGEAGVMVTLRRIDSPRYRCTLGLVPLTKVADRERQLPPHFLGDTLESREKYRDYVAPLVGAELDPPATL